MSESTQRRQRPLAIPIRVILLLLAGLGVLAIGIRQAQSETFSRWAVFLQLGGLIICVRALYEGTRSIRLSHLTSPVSPANVRPLWGNREVAITSEGLIFIVVMFATFIAAFLGKSNLLLLVFSFLSATFVLNGAVTQLMLEKNRVSRKLPHHIMVGEVLSVEVELSNRRRRLSSWMMILQDQIQSTHELLQPRVLFRRVPPRTGRSAWYQARFAHRGRYLFGPLKLLTRFPLGFTQRGSRIEQSDTLIVHPRVASLTHSWNNDSADAEDVLRHRRTRLGTHEDDFHRLREFRSGDNPKAIHWLSTARNNELMVREYHEARDRDLILCLDLWSETSSDELDPQVERAVSFAASILVDHCRRNRGSSVAIGIAGEGRFSWKGPAGPNVIPHLLDELALVRHAISPPTSEVLQECREIQWSKSRRILITTRSSNDLDSSVVNSERSGSIQDHRSHFMIFESSSQTLAKYLS